jgi:hypothetical protein
MGGTTHDEYLGCMKHFPDAPNTLYPLPQSDSDFHKARFVENRVSRITRFSNNVMRQQYIA